MGMGGHDRLIPFKIAAYLRGFRSINVISFKCCRKEGGLSEMVFRTLIRVYRKKYEIPGNGNEKKTYNFLSPLDALKEKSLPLDIR